MWSDWVIFGAITIPSLFWNTRLMNKKIINSWGRVFLTTILAQYINSGVSILQLRYTEATDNVIKSFPTSNINNYNRTQTNTTGAVVSISAVCHVKASTDIKYYTTFSPFVGSPKYNLHVTIEKLDY